MFPRKKRLVRSAFPQALNRGRRYSSENFSIISMNGIDGYAVIVPNKIARLSVTRHKIKRRVMEAIKTLSLPRAMVIFPKSSAIKMEYKDMRDELARLFSKIKE